MASLVLSGTVAIGLRGRRSAGWSGAGAANGARIARDRDRAFWWRACAIAFAVGLITFEQVAPTLQSLHGGISEFDSLAYHLPTAARWVQQGTISPIHQLYPGALWAYYPYNAEVLHAVGMAAFGRDLLSPFMNLGFLGLALLACWAIGAGRGAGRPQFSPVRWS